MLSNMLASKCNCSTYFVFKKLSFFNEKLKNVVFNPDFSKLPGVNNIALRNVQVRKIGGKIKENYNPRETEIGSRNREFGKTESSKNWEFGFNCSI